jgi:hypothetical protein
MSQTRKSLDLETRLYNTEKEIISLAENQRSLVHTVENYIKFSEKQHTEMVIDIQNRHRESMLKIEEIVKNNNDNRKINWGWFFGGIGVIVTLLGIYIKSETMPIKSINDTHNNQIIKLNEKVDKTDEQFWQLKGKIDLILSSPQVR